MIPPSELFVGLFHGTSRRGAIAAGALLLAGLLGTGQLTRHERADAEAEASQEFAASCREIQAKIEVRLAAHEQILRSAGAFFADDNGVTRAEWHEFAERQKINQTLPGIQGLGFALLVPRAQLEQHVQTVRAEGFPAYRVWPEGERATYSAVVFLEPFAGRNLRAFGYDMTTEPVRRAAMERARDRDEVALSGKVTLVQEDGQDPQAGTLMYMPVYRMGAPRATVAERRAALVGWVYSPYRMRDLISAGMLGRWDLAVQRQIHLEIFDGETPAPAALLYDSQHHHGPPAITAPGAAHEIELAVAGRHWVLRFSPADGTGARVDYGRAWLVFASGTLISLLIASLVLSLANTRSGARRMAERLTADLRRSEERWKFALESAGDGVWDWNLAAGEIFFSPRWKAMLGYAPDEIGAGLEEWSSRVHPEDLPRAMADVQAHLDAGTAGYSSEHRMRAKDGTWRWILDRGLVVAREAGGAPLRMIGTHTDITARKQAERALRESEEKFARVFQFAPVWIAVTDLTDGTYLDVNDEALRATGFSRAEVLGRTALDFAWITPADRLRIGQALETHGRIVSMEMAFRAKDGRTLHGWVNGETIVLGGHACLLTITTDITARKQAEAALAASEANYRRLFEGMLDGFALHEILCDAAGRPVDYRFLSVNPAFERLTGLRAADIVGRTVRDVLPQTEPSWIERYGRVALTGEGVEFEDYSGALGRHFEVAATCPQPGQFATVFIDITANKQAETALRDSEERYRALVEWSPEAIVVHRGGRFVYGNPTAIKLIGAGSAADLFGQPFLDRICPEDRPLVLARAKAAAAGQVNLPMVEIRFVRLDGSLVEVESQSTAITYNGAPAFHVSARDITARKQAEAALRRSEERYRSILNASPDDITITDLTGRILLVSPAALPMFGFTDTAEIIGRPIADFIVPADRDRVAAVIARMFAGVMPGPTEVRGLRRDGSSFELEATAEFVRDEIGRPANMVFVVRDTTVRTQAQRALQTSLRDKEALLKEVHHRVKNNLQVIMSLLRMEARRSVEVGTQTVLGEMQGRIRSMALLHESLYRSGTFAAVDLGAYLRQLATQSLRTLGTAPGAIRLRLDLPSVHVEMDQALPCGLLVNELISNSLKHAFPLGRSGEVHLTLEPVPGGSHWRLQVSDDGIGLPADFAAKRGHSLGLQLVTDLAGQLRGTLEIGPAAGPGAAFTVTFTIETPQLPAVPA